MSLKKQIAEDFKAAFKNKDTERKSVLSLIGSDIKNKEIELGKREEGLADEEVVAVLVRAIKQRKDSVQQYQAAGRAELAQKEQREIDILSKYLPSQMDDAELEKQIIKIIKEAGAEGAGDFGKVMGKAMSVLKGKADGAKVKEIAEKLLK